MQLAKLALDNTLRYLYITIRNRRARLVAIEFSHRGKRWRADTVDEALKLRAALEQADLEAATPEDEEWRLKAESVWTPDVFWDFVQSIGRLQKKVIVSIMNKPQITSAELAEHLGIDESSLAGVFSGLSKQLKKLDLKPMQLYQVTTSWNGKQKTRSFYTEYAFKLAADEAGWPDAKEKDAASTKQSKHKKH